MDIINEFKGEYGFLSNFARIDIEYKGLVYPNAEAAFQAQKCATKEAKLKYTRKLNPFAVKQMGKKEPNLPANWNEIAYDIMAEILRIKFSDKKMKEKLVATGDAYLEEGNNWHDNRWGHCYCDKCKSKDIQNWLGKILMQIRQEINESN